MITAHWPEYLIEAALLGLFMVSACCFGVVLGHPTSPVVRRIRLPIVRRLLVGIAMGATAVALIYSPWGRRSGAHMNPATTLTFWWLGKVGGVDAAMYALAQVVGGLAGVGSARMLLGPLIRHLEVNHVATVPGRLGAGWAWIVEVVISFVLMSGVLWFSNDPRLAAWTGVLAGCLVATFIVAVAPVSGMSMNPARSLASAVPGRAMRWLWIYFTAPPLGMLLAAGVHGTADVKCAKLCHLGHERCIFHCGYEAGNEIEAQASETQQDPRTSAR